ncbi:MAG TPA: hypothetical protein VJT67_16015 [Longimicrobiaceae bacterium]|nr:hypothetical protein [Longimicrobiaceae bacterium]
MTRVGSLTLAYHQADYLELSLRELAPQVDVMYVMYATEPFTAYNPAARHETFADDGTGAILQRLGAELPHLRVLSGRWACEEEMRNAGLDAARRDGLSVLFVVDADEFFAEGTFGRARSLIARDDVSGCWSMRMRVPFRRPDRVIDRDDEYLPLAVRIAPEIRFERRRLPNVTRVALPETVTCYNMGFLLPDARMYEKTRTWSHGNQLPARWFEEKWLGWTPQTTDLHTRVPPLWPCTRAHDPERYPRALRGHPLVCGAAEA